MNLQDAYKRFNISKQSGLKQKTNPISTGGNFSNRVLLVDGMNMYIRAFAATPTMNDDGDHMGGVTGFLLSLGATIRQFKPSLVVVIFDGKNGSLRRRKLFPQYKGGRKFMTKLNRTYEFKTLEDEVESREKQLELLNRILMNLPVILINNIENVEADDIIAFSAHTLSENGNDVIVVSSDKDFLQLVNERISVWSPIKKRMYTPDRVVEDYGFHPNNFLLYRTVTGDASDCIPGVMGIKEKTLLKYFPELAEPEVRDVDFLMESATRHVSASKKPPAALVHLLESREQLTLNHSLMRLDEVAMSGITKSTVLKWLDSEVNTFNKMELTKHIRFNKLMHAFVNYESWLQNTFIPLLRYKLKS